MNNEIIKDLTAKKGVAVYTLMQHFNQHAGWCGYFFDGKDAQALASIGTYERRPQDGLHVTVWHRRTSSLTPASFIRLVTAQDKYDATILGYGDDGKNQAVSVSRPPIYMAPAMPHITVSWVNTGNPSASGYMQFSTIPPQSVPPVIHGGTPKIMMRNGQEMDLGIFRSQIKALEIARMNEISAALDPKVKDEIDKHLDTMTWEEIKNRFISNGVEFNENMARLYTRYRIDITEAEQREAMEEDAERDRQTDEEWEKDAQETGD